MDLQGYVEGMINFDDGGGGTTTVIANPEGTPTDELNSIQVNETIYSVGGGGESIVPTPTNADRGKYLGVKSDADELEYRTVRELPDSEGASAGTVLTHTVSGESWLPPAEELPPYSTVQNDKVLGVHNGALEWVEQSGGSGGINFIDTNNIIAQGKYTSTFSYTATVDCWIYANLVASMNSGSFAYINNVPVANIYNALTTAGSVQRSVLIPLKSGQTFSINNSEAWSCDYTVIAMS